MVPWTGIQGTPAFLVAAVRRGGFRVEDIAGLQAYLESPTRIAGLARVAYTGRFSDLLDDSSNPIGDLGTAAFVNLSYFQRALTAQTYQIGTVPIVTAQQKYNVAFSEEMSALPRIQLQVFMADDAGAMYNAMPTLDSVTTTGFSFWLSTMPAADGGSVQWEAKVQAQP